MGPAAALASSALTVSGSCLETAALFGKSSFILKGEFEECLWSWDLPPGAVTV